MNDILVSCGFLVVLMVFVALAARSAAAALALLVLVDPFALYWHLGFTDVTLPLTALLGFAVGLAFNRDVRSARPDGRTAQVAFAAGLVVLATALSYWHAEYRLPVIRETLKALEYLLTFLVCTTAYRVEPRPVLIQQALIAIASVVAIVALVQEITGAPSAVLIGTHAVNRISGPLEGPNQLAGYLELLLPLLVLFSADRVAGWWCFAALVLVGSAEVLTFSRSGVLSAIVGIAVAVIATRRTANANWFGIVGLPLAFFAILASFFGGRFTQFWFHETSDQDTLVARRELWMTAYRLWRKQPLYGIGVGNENGHLHSLIVQSAVQGGIPLLAAVVWANVLPIVLLVRTRSQDALVVGVLGGAVALALHQTVDDLSFYPKVGMMLWMLLGIAFGVASGSKFLDRR